MQTFNNFAQNKGAYTDVNKQAIWNKTQAKYLGIILKDMINDKDKEIAFDIIEYGDKFQEINFINNGIKINITRRPNYDKSYRTIINRSKDRIPEGYTKIVDNIVPDTGSGVINQVIGTGMYFKQLFSGERSITGKLK